MKEQTVKGPLMQSTVSIVKEQKGPEGVLELEQKFGSLDFHSFQEYPLSERARLEDVACDILYGDHSAESHCQFAQLSFKNHSQSILGKTLLAILVGGNMKKVLLGIPKIMEHFQKEQGFTFTVEDLGENKVRAHIKDSYYNIGFFAGKFIAGVRFFGAEPTVAWKELGIRDYEYIIEWEDKKKE